MAHEKSFAPDQESFADNARLASLIDELVAAARSGKRIDIEEVAGKNPDMADELRELWAIASLAEEFGSQSNMADDRDSGTTNAKPWTSSSLIADEIGDYELLEELGRGGM